ncbi:hypothetical protein [Plantactinospora endophytica]|nr:hypothetical protein [Plantactinospora endophytica]
MHSGPCVGVPGGATEHWASARQVACDLSEPGQIFAFDPGPDSASSASGG